MASFEPNPNAENEPWIEKQAIAGYEFRNWHLLFICLAAVITILVMICCCVKIRIPRTKLEIEGDYRRKKLARKFQEKLGLIQNQDLDALDLQQALKIIQEDFEQEQIHIQNQLALEGCQKSVVEMNNEAKVNDDDDEMKQTNFARKFAAIMIKNAEK